MRLTPQQINTFLFFELPAAFLCGVRVKAISPDTCIVMVCHRWINQNPFRSMYFAVQVMAGELSTGALVMSHIRKSGKDLSMLVRASKASFTKKATGRIIFTCCDGLQISNAVAIALDSGEGQVLWVKSIGKDETGDIVSEMEFEWRIKALDLKP